jgi:hypothetical protein
MGPEHMINTYNDPESLGDVVWDASSARTRDLLERDQETVDPSPRGSVGMALPPRSLRTVWRMDTPAMWRFRPADDIPADMDYASVSGLRHGSLFTCDINEALSSQS